MAVDVGNTQTVLGLFDGEELRGQWRIATEAHRTADELAVFFAGLLALEGLRLDEISAVPRSRSAMRAASTVCVSTW